MRARNGQPSPPEDIPGTGAVRARSRPPEPEADENQVVLPVTTGESPPPVPSAPASSPPVASAPVASPSVPRAPGPARRPPTSAVGSGPPARPRRPEPSWGTVLVTTLRLWAQRRLRRARQLRWPARGGWRLVIIVALVAAVSAAGAVTVALVGNQRPASQAHGTRNGGHRQAQPAADPAAAVAAAATRAQAAAWIASQAGADAIVACDPAMCAALQRHGLPSGQLLTLGPGRPGPLGADLVAATDVVRNRFGARLAGLYAPVTFAAFGSGSARIDIRAVAPGGAVAYLAALSADQGERRAAGLRLLRNPRIRARAHARALLAAGDIDSRLLVALAALAARHPLTIVRFGRPAPGASDGVPLRSAVITGARGPRGRRPAWPRVLRAFLAARRAPYRPSSLELVPTGRGRAGLAVQFPVPGPLGLLGARG